MVMLKSGMRIQKRLRSTIERHGWDCSDEYGWDKPLGGRLLAIEFCIGHCHVVLYSHADRTRGSLLRINREREHILRITKHDALAGAWAEAQAIEASIKPTS